MSSQGDDGLASNGDEVLRILVAWLRRLIPTRVQDALASSTVSSGHSAFHRAAFAA